VNYVVSINSKINIAHGTIFLTKVEIMIFSRHGNGYHAGGSILEKVEISRY